MTACCASVATIYNPRCCGKKPSRGILFSIAQCAGFSGVFLTLANNTVPNKEAKVVKKLVSQ